VVTSAPPAETPAVKRETWPKWLPASVHPEDVPTITREELLARLAKQQIHVTDRELRYWEHEGILPQPVRKYHEGAMYAFYPAWHEEVVSEIASLRQKPRAHRLSFAELRPVARSEFTQTCRQHQGVKASLQADGPFFEHVPPAQVNALSGALMKALLSIRDETRQQFPAAEVTFIDDQGGAISKLRVKLVERHT
jgi:DNA-binding transcriptional MerR regulator